MRLCDTDEYKDDEPAYSDIAATVSRAIADENTEETTHEPEEVPENTPQAPSADTYGLSKEDIDFISTLLQSSECGRRGIDDEATVERINEAFSDGFGDVIIEDTGDGFAIIEDYKEEIEEWLKNI